LRVLLPPLIVRLPPLIFVRLSPPIFVCLALRVLLPPLIVRLPPLIFVCPASRVLLLSPLLVGLLPPVFIRPALLLRLSFRHTCGALGRRDPCIGRCGLRLSASCHHRCDKKTNDRLAHGLFLELIAAS
jgi:hypothetical protein